MLGVCEKPTPMMISYPCSANARIAGSIEVGSPGSTSRKTIGRSLAARLTPCHAAALKERSSFPPISKTIPTSTFDLSSAAYPDTRHAEVSATAMQPARIVHRTDFIPRALYSKHKGFCAFCALYAFLPYFAVRLRSISTDRSLLVRGCLFCFAATQGSTSSKEACSPSDSAAGNLNCGQTAITVRTGVFTLGASDGMISEDCVRMRLDARAISSIKDPSTARFVGSDKTSVRVLRLNRSV